MRALRTILWALVAVALGVFAYLSFAPPRSDPPVAGTLAAPPAPLAIGGPFTLTGADGKPFSSRALDGRPYALFFGFTHCPDVCPTTLARLTRLRKELAGKAAGAEPFAIVFVSVDPERDGPAEVGAYSTLFATPIIGLTGTRAQVAAVERLFGATSRIEGTGDAREVVHTATVFLMDAQGRFLATIAPEESDDAARAKLRRLVG